MERDRQASCWIVVADEYIGERASDPEHEDRGVADKSFSATLISSPLRRGDNPSTMITAPACLAAAKASSGFTAPRRHL
jgi:hypothetical protein